MQRHNKESSAPPMKGKVGLVYYSQSQTTEKQNSRWVGVGRVVIEPSPRRHHVVTTTASFILHRTTNELPPNVVTELRQWQFKTEPQNFKTSKSSFYKNRNAQFYCG